MNTASELYNTAELEVVFANLRADAEAASNGCEMGIRIVEAAAPEILNLHKELEALEKQLSKKWVLQKDRAEQHGIKRPSAGTVCAETWEAVEALGIQGATAKQVRALATDKGWNVNNTVIEFYNCRKFHGIVGRAAKA